MAPPLRFGKASERNARRRAERDADIMRLSASGMSCREVGDALGVSAATVSRVLNGRVVKTPRTLPPLDVRFWERVERGTAEECWNWSAGKNRYGYGHVYVEGRTLRAHRVAWELTYGEIPDGMMVCHSCDNPACCNPEHLWLGDQELNMADMVRKGRVGYDRAA